MSLPDRPACMSGMAPLSPSTSALTLGIPYRPEGQCLWTTFNAVAVALDFLPSDLPREVIVCVNGATEDQVAQTQDLLHASPLVRHGARLTTSRPGKLLAQREIVAQRRLHGIVGFVDSDVAFDPRALRRLWDHLLASPGSQVVYAQPVPVMPDHPSFLHRLLRVHYSLRDRTYSRPFLHGRAFLMREWMELEPAAATCPNVADLLTLDRGPLIDDIYLSRIIVARWGAGSIQEVRHANVYFDPPDTLRGLYAAALRAAWEVERLDTLYPEHAMLQKTLFRRVWRCGSLRRHTLRLRAAHLIYRLLDSSVKRLAGIRAKLARIGVAPLRNPWIDVPGTKGLGESALRKRW